MKYPLASFQNQNEYVIVGAFGKSLQSSWLIGSGSGAADLMDLVIS